MKLYYDETPNPWKACAVARYLDLPVEFVHIDLAKGANKTPEFLRVNPNGKVPALADGARTLWEANAIICYLADTAKSDLWPKDDRQIDIIRWFNWETAHFSRHGGALFFEYVIRPRFGLGEPDPAVVAESSKFFRQFAAVLNDHLAGRDYLVGDNLTVADFAVAMTLAYREEAHLPLEDAPHVRRWYETRIASLEAWRHPFPAVKAAA